MSNFSFKDRNFVLTIMLLSKQYNEIHHYDFQYFKIVYMHVHVWSSAKCLSMRETKGIVASSAPQASMERWPFGTSRYKHTQISNRRSSEIHFSFHLPALTLMFVSVFTSSESRSFYPGSPHHVKKSCEWMKRRCGLTSTPRPHPQVLPSSPLSASTPPLLRRSQ